MPTNYTGNPVATQAPAPTPAAAAIPILALPNDGEAANIASLHQGFKVLADYIAWMQTVGLPALGGLQYGDGTNGDYTPPAGATALAVNLGGSMNYRNLNIGATTQLYAHGNIIRVKETLTIASGGYIQPWESASMVGGNGAGAVGGSAGKNNGDDLYNYIGLAGGLGGAAVTNGGAGTVAPSFGASVGGGLGGTGGATATGQTGGTGGTAGVVISDLRPYVYGIPGFGYIAGSLNGLNALVGGTGGGGGAGTTGAGGGGGGAGGSPLWIFARRLVMATATDLRSPGGAGGNGAGAAGGGAGGGGGYIVVVTGALTGGPITAAAVPGGAAGSGGSTPATAGAVGNWVMMGLG